MAKFTFLNVSAGKTFDVDKITISPTLVYDPSTSVEAALTDQAIKAGIVRLPVFEHGVHQFTSIKPGEVFTVETDNTAEIAFYTNLVESINGDIVEAKIVSGGNPAVSA